MIQDSLNNQSSEKVSMAATIQVTIIYLIKVIQGDERCLKNQK